jgi:hypothetical protein
MQVQMKVNPSLQKMQAKMTPFHLNSKSHLQ